MKIVSLIFGLLASASAIELTDQNWTAETAGRTVFVKYLAPWWGHCKTMKPDWDKLIDSFKDDPAALVADVDCTAGGETLCKQHGVTGYPTLKYGDPSDLQDYKGARTYDALKTFADANLVPLCSVENVDLCDEEKQGQIKSYQSMDADALAAAIAAEEKKLTDIEEYFKKSVANLQSQYEKLQKESKDTADAVVASGLGLMKSVTAQKSAVGNDEL